MIWHIFTGTLNQQTDFVLPSAGQKLSATDSEANWFRFEGTLVLRLLTKSALITFRLENRARENPLKAGRSSQFRVTRWEGEHSDLTQKSLYRHHTDALCEMWMEVVL
jgi:hypothetical protein